MLANASIQLVQMLQSCQNNLFTGLLDFTRQEDFIQDSVYLVKVEDQIQLANIPKEGIQHLYKEMYCLQICQLIIIRIHTGTEEETRIAAVDDLRGIPELDEVGLVLLISRGDEAMDLVGCCELSLNGKAGCGEGDELRLSI